MERLAKKKPRPRRSFTPKSNAGTVKLRQRGEEVAKDFDPVTLHPFIEVENHIGRNVNRACEFPKVS